MLSNLHAIPHFPGYAVSRDGCVWSHRAGTWREVKAFSNGKGGGYLKVKLYRDREAHQLKVHAIVATVFLGPRPPGMTVNHKDGVKANNTPENLEWCTVAENNRHARATGLTPPAYTHTPRPARVPTPPKVRKTAEEKRAAIQARLRRGETNEHHKLTEDDVRELRRLHDVEGTSFGALAIRFGISKPQARRIVLRLKWAHVA